MKPLLRMDPAPETSKRASLDGHSAQRSGRILGDNELLALVLQPSNSAPDCVAAAEILEASGGLEGACRLTPQGLAMRTGLAHEMATRFAAALELGRRALERTLGDERESIDSFDAVVRWARPRLAGLDHEEVWLLAIDARNQLESARRIAQGGLHACSLSVRDVFRAALRSGATAIVLVHNHPSGDPTPSREDQIMTQSVAMGGQVLGLPLLDHIIVTRRSAVSLLGRQPPCTSAPPQGSASGPPK